MEKYEINKFISEYELKLNDLKVALNVEGKKPVLAELEKETVKDDFWFDQAKAQDIISQVNQLKEIINSYTDLENKYKDILDLVEMALEDSEAMELLE